LPGPGRDREGDGVLRDLGDMPVAEHVARLQDVSEPVGGLDEGEEGAAPNHARELERRDG
jgi:hypothetical protein